MAKLDGKIILIAGGSGNVGEGIVPVFLKQGATVIVPSRRQDSLDKLGKSLGDLATNYVPMVANIGTLEGSEKLRDEIIAKFGHLDGVLVSLGGWWTGNKPLTEVDLETWESYLNGNLTSHFLCAKTFLPLLAKTKGSSYTLLGGTAAEVPLANVSPVGITAAGQLMMAKIVMEEMKDSGVRINEVIIQGMVKTKVMQAYSQPNWITPQEIGEFTSWLASDEAYMITNSILHINQRSEKAS
jgi:NAD(P)-dependent dehydrogenase (short-subunit alcohol dehydrogenase family)